MHKLSKELDRKSLERIYEIYFRSKLEYANTVLSDSFEHDKMLFKNCQLQAASIILLQVLKQVLVKKGYMVRQGG